MGAKSRLIPSKVALFIDLRGLVCVRVQPEGVVQHERKLSGLSVSDAATSSLIAFWRKKNLFRSFRFKVYFPSHPGISRCAASQSCQIRQKFHHLGIFLQSLLENSFREIEKVLRNLTRKVCIIVNQTCRNA